jgi:peptidoglycan/LPS O-acetylase OafA/YrhL
MGVPTRHHALDLIRGLAALAVSQYHFMYWNQIANVESMGTFAVYLFFVLSGLTMMMMYGDRFAVGITPDVLRGFYRKRMARLIPLLLVVAALAFIRQAMSGGYEPIKALMTGTGLMALHMPGLQSNSIGAWSLGIELAFYAVFPIVAALTQTWRQAAIAAALLISAQHLLLFQIREMGEFWSLYVSNLTFAPFFALGLLIYFDKGPRHRPAAGAAVALLAVTCLYSLAVPTDLMRDSLSYFVLTLLAAGAVWAAWRAELPKWLVTAAAFLGNISYSLYLLHWIAAEIARRVSPDLYVQWPLYIAMALLGAWTSYHFFENPLRLYFGRGSRSNRHDVDPGSLPDVGRGL